MTITGALPRFLQRLTWNIKYMLGYGAGKLQRTANTIAQQVGTGSILDLGCGAGSFLQCLRAGGFRGRYTGVDLSQQAIDRAKRLQDPLAEWHVSPIDTYSSGRFDCVCLIESLYYLDLHTAERTLASLPLESSGACFVRIHDTKRHAKYVKLLKSRSFREVAPNLMVYRPKASQSFQ